MQQEDQRKLSRTDWAEKQVEEFVSLPFISEFVFRSLKTFDKSEKEVIDFMLMHGESAILISQKAQDDPLKRTSEKNEAWVRKNAKRAASQLMGAIRPRVRGVIWCEHARRGRIEFGTELPRPLHGIVLAETFTPVDLQGDAEELPHQYEAVPISYFSVNDFLNLVYELRSIPDLLSYLSARRCLAADCLRVIGGEKPIFEYYILNDGTLDGCLGHADAKIVSVANERELQVKFERRQEEVFYAQYLEYVGNCLATRNDDYAIGLSPDLLAAYDDPNDRHNFIVMQEVLAGLTMAERAQVGRALLKTAAKLENQMEGFVYQATHFPSHDRVFVLCSSKDVARLEVLERIGFLLRGAMAFYKTRNCLVIVDRDGEGFEIAESKMERCTSSDEALGNHYFAHLRTTSLILDAA